MNTACIILAACLLGGWVSHMCGGGKPKLPWGLDQWLYAIPYALVYFVCPWVWFISAPVSALSYGAAFGGKRTGHGQYIHLGTYRQPPAQDERLDFIVKLFFGPDNGGAYWRCVFGLALTGAVCALGAAGVFAAIGEWGLAGLVLAGGAAKGLAYIIGRSVIYKTGVFLKLVRPNLGKPNTLLEAVFHPTIWGEILTGVFGWGSLGAALAIAILK